MRVTRKGRNGRPVSDKIKSLEPEIRRRWLAGDEGLDIARALGLKETTLFTAVRRLQLPPRTTQSARYVDHFALPGDFKSSRP